MRHANWFVKREGWAGLHFEELERFIGLQTVHRLGRPTLVMASGITNFEWDENHRRDDNRDD